MEWLQKDVAIAARLIYNGQLTQPALKPLGDKRIVREYEQKAGETTPSNYVLIIDEINRGNISNILGELITLIEDDKRSGQPNEIQVQLPCSKELFSLPPNLYVLGTMNTADRSIALVDMALRRRFDFEELVPRADLLSPNLDGINVQRLLLAINGRLELMVDRDHTIGHAYFINCRTAADVSQVLVRKVIPLLQEYFYDDLKHVAHILNDHRRSPETKIIQVVSLSEQKLFGTDLDGIQDGMRYEVPHSISVEQIKGHLRMTVRTIHEYGSLGIERDDRDVRLTRQQANLLEGISDSFKRGQKDRLIDWYRSDEMLWRQYVGVVQIGDLTLEILPKIARHAVNDDADRAYLLRMLAESGMLPIAMDELANFTTQKWTLLDLVIYSFALEVKKQLHRGRIQRYEFVEEERSTIRGKLLVGKHARRDPIRQLRFPCRFSKFTPNTSINRLLRTAAREGWKLTQHAVVRQALAWVEQQLDDVDMLSRPYANSIPSIVYDRTTVRYQRSCTLAEQILRGLAPHVHTGRTEYAALLFDMNELFERWVAAGMQKSYARHGTSVMCKARIVTYTPTRQATPSE
ncbi:MAG: AAA family ATPase [Ignavibacteria bacterium]|nr:AAA family ATPase [Ignavibacteria bacterium]